jgi:hypothetical protein
MAKCPAGTIFNPATGKCVLVTGSVGRKLVASGKATTVITCKRNKVVNPKTKTCVKTSGTIGRQLTNTSIRISAKGEIEKVRNGRKGPSGHAKNHKNQVAVGNDGNLWISQAVGEKKVYRWKKLSV